MVEPERWSVGQEGNYHSFTSADGAVLPKGEYILEVKNLWFPETENYPYNELKKQTLRLASP